MSPAPPELPDVRPLDGPRHTSRRQYYQPTCHAPADGGISPIRRKHYFKAILSRRCCVTKGVRLDTCLALNFRLSRWFVCFAPKYEAMPCCEGSSQCEQAMHRRGFAVTVQLSGALSDTERPAATRPCKRTKHPAPLLSRGREIGADAAEPPRSLFATEAPRHFLLQFHHP